MWKCSLLFFERVCDGLVFFLKKFYLKLFLSALGLCCCKNLVASRHVGSSWTRDQNYVPCIARQTLNHWAMTEACINSSLNI